MLECDKVSHKKIQDDCKLEGKLQKEAVSLNWQEMIHLKKDYLLPIIIQNSKH